MKSIFPALVLFSLFSLPPCFADAGLMAGTMGMSSPGAVNTELGKYKQYVYAVVGSYWYPDVNRHTGLIPPGTVQVEFTVHSDGTLTDVSVRNVTGKFSDLLKVISKQDLEKPAPFKPFSAALIKEIGKSYTDTFSFTVKG